ncbi:MAG: hypothetical protein RIQ46_559, partial [Pseudomonadota bacterium]
MLRAMRETLSGKSLAAAVILFAL